MNQLAQGLIIAGGLLATLNQTWAAPAAGKLLTYPERKKARDLYVSQGCIACHQLDKLGGANQLYVGPTMAAVGSHYANDPKGLETILHSLQMGAKGKWGQNEMPPQTHLTGEDARHLARWILTLRPKAEGDDKAAPATPPKTAEPGFYSPLISEKRVSTVVEVGDVPVVYRVYLPGASSRAIAVGLPQKLGGISYAFDAADCRLLYVWSGGFLDMDKAWTGFGGWYAKLLGAKIYQAPACFPLRIGKPNEWPEKPELVFKGYRIVEGQPEFLYQVNAQEVAHRITYQARADNKSASNTGQITHHFSLPGVTDEVSFLPTKQHVHYDTEDATWASGVLLVHADKRVRFSVSITLKP
ncbi:MAG: c-type cytochrome [Akkermansiaceae bacterium]|nr:c-type cytochrome [Akkermansiaceae bacterium]